jgi:hypothetical protein
VWAPLDRQLKKHSRSARRIAAAARIELRYWSEVRLRRKPPHDLTRYERRVYSQFGEDGILRAIFGRIGTTNRYFVEFGVEDGRECNTRYLAERRGWRGLLMDLEHEDPRRNLHRERVTAENVNELFEKYGVPRAFDLLSIDIDGNDYWVWRSLAPHWRPRVVVIEYNASAGPVERRSIAYDPFFRWTGTNYQGASLAALAAVGTVQGYTLIACDSHGVNAFFVRDDLVEGNFARRALAELYRPPDFLPGGGGHPPDPTRQLVPV